MASPPRRPFRACSRWICPGRWFPERAERPRTATSPGVTASWLVYPGWTMSGAGTAAPARTPGQGWMAGTGTDAAGAAGVGQRADLVWHPGFADQPLAPQWL